MIKKLIFFVLIIFLSINFSFSQEENPSKIKKYPILGLEFDTRSSFSLKTGMAFING
tara:strand:- start:163 stop:333 length:171 start_codon:yes stop_codon:yes gene_type:complete